MKSIKHISIKSIPFKRFGLFCALGGVVLLAGCASTSDSSSAAAAQSSGAKVPSMPGGVTLHKDKDINGVWLAEGFDFKGYDALYIENPSFAAIERPNEAKMREMALRALPQSLADYLQQTKVFPTVTTRVEDLKPGTKALRMTSAIIEYEKGGGGARFWAGVYGAGQPVIKVRGQILEGDKLLGVYELKRSGESVGARMGGVFQSDEEIQRNDIRDLSSDLADFVKRTAKVQ